MNLQYSFAGADRWSLLPGIVSLAIIQVLALLCQLPGIVSFVLVPLALVGLSIGASVVFVATVSFLVKRRPRSAASVFQIVLLPVLLWLPIVRIANLTHLGLTVWFGVGQLGVLETSNDRRPTVYDWSVGLAGGSNILLLRDQTDEIALPLPQHRHAPSFDIEFEKDCSGNVQHLLGHYHVCTF